MTHNGADPLGNQIHVAVGDRNGKVLLAFDRPVQNWVLDPQNAFQIGEAIARAAHTARFGQAPLKTDGPYIAEQVKARVTDEIRTRMVLQAGFALRSMLDQGHKPDYMARELVDRILSEVA